MALSVGRVADGDWELAIGLEVHAQLRTASKMFCGCSADYAGAAPNTHVCPVCLGLPGALPVPNAQAVALAAATGLALGCRVATETWFDRKSFHYPDLPKGFQITQHEAPLCREGRLVVAADGGSRAVGIERVHLEEDTGKSIHRGADSLLDYNRAGVPLVEVVTRPDLRTPDEARALVDALRHVLRWIGTSSADMAAGALRVDVNVSVRPTGEPALGTKVEIKNLNSLSAVRAALGCERARIIGLLSAGGTVRRETRGWDESAGQTFEQRSKEHAHDYRYFPEPDLPRLALEPTWIEERRAILPELPWERRDRLRLDHGLSGEEARLLTRDRATADYFEAAAAAYDGPAVEIARWVTGPVFGQLGAAGLDMASLATRVPPAEMARLVAMIGSDHLSRAAAKTVVAAMVTHSEPAVAAVAREGLDQLSDAAALGEAAADVIAGEPRAVEAFRSGKRGVVDYLVGQALRATGGRANPGVVRTLIEAALDEDVDA